MHHYENGFLEEMKSRVFQFMGIRDKDVRVDFVDHSSLNKKDTEVVMFGLYTEYNRTAKMNRNAEILLMLSCMFHELWHHVQYRTNKLENILDEDGILTHFRFEDVYYDYDYPYDMRPWEVEANKKQKELFTSFLSTVDKDFLNRLLVIHTNKGEKTNGVS